MSFLGWLLGREPAKPTPPTETPKGEVPEPLAMMKVNSAEATRRQTAGIRGGSMSITPGRQSQEDMGLSQGSFGFRNLYDRYDGIEASRRDVIKLVREHSNLDDDVSGTRTDFIALINSGYSFSFEGRGATRAEQATNELAKEVYKEGGGLNGFINNQIGELFDTGNLSAEYYTDESNSCVLDVVTVPAENVTAQRDEDGRWQFYQDFDADHRIELNELTYSSVAYMPRKHSPFGIPLPLGALHSLSRKRKIIDGLNRLVAFIADGNMVIVKVPAFDHNDFAEDFTGPTDPAYLTKIEEITSEIASSITNRADHSTIIVPSFPGGELEVEVIPISREVTGVFDVQEANMREIHSALPTAPFLRGKLESTTQALSRVVWLILVAQAKIVQSLMKDHILKLVNLNLRLLGIAAVATMEFDEPENPFEADSADAMLTEAQADLIYVKMLGAPYLAQVAAKLGLTMSEQEINDALEQSERANDNNEVPIDS